MEEKINLTDLFKTDKEFEKKLEETFELAKKYPTFKGHLYDSAKGLYEFLEYDTNLSKEIERLYIYAHVNSDLDLSNSKYQEYVGKVLNLFSFVSEENSFVLPELISKDEDYFHKLEEEYPSLKEYELNLKDIFRKKKLVLSDNEEALVSILTTNFDKAENTSELLINTDLDYGFIKDENGKKVKLTNSNYSVYLESSNEKVRRDAFKTFYKEIKAHENTFSSLLAMQISNDNKLAKIRHFSDARELSLYSNNVNNGIYDSLVSGVHENLQKFYKYFDLKKEILGVKELHIYDTYATITKDYDKTYTYKEAKDVILKALAPLGEKYISDLNRTFDEGWIDARILKGKRSGGYCTCAYLAHPYVVVNFEKKLDDVSTIAHELGHAMHYLYAQTNNRYQDYNYSIFVAEVASQVNEILLTEYIYKNLEDVSAKKYLLDLILKRFKATIIRQTMFAEYEDIIHKLENNKVVLTKDVLEEEYYKLNKLYFGPNVFVDEEIKYEMYRIPHFYYNFYVYQYATGYAAALKIANNILNGKDIDKYLEFLSLGSTKDPVESLKVAGVDMNDASIYNEIFDVFMDKLNKLRSLYE